MNRLTQIITRFPVALICVALSILGFMLVYVDQNYSAVRYLMYFDIHQQGRVVVFSVPSSQYWRLISPMFLHFSVMHLAFNMALFWFVGHRIEYLQGSIRLLSVVLVTGIGANVLQASLAQPSLFGGMSGVVFGLFGYAWVWDRIRTDRSLQIPPGIVYFLLVMMALGFVGFARLFGVDAVANVAHLGGFAIGLVMGLGAAAIDK